MPNNNVTPASLRVIRIALLGGVLLFGGVVWYLHSTGSAPASGMPFPGATWVFVAVCVIAATGILVIRGAQERAGTFAQRATLAIVAWALAEGAALLGGVHWLLTGRPTLYLAGLAIFLAGLTTVGAAE